MRIVAVVLHEQRIERGKLAQLKRGNAGKLLIDEEPRRVAVVAPVLAAPVLQKRLRDAEPFGRRKLRHVFRRIVVLGKLVAHLARRERQVAVVVAQVAGV